MRSLAFMDGVLYAGIGDYADALIIGTQTNGAMVLSKASPSAAWVQDGCPSVTTPGQQASCPPGSFLYVMSGATSPRNNNLFMGVDSMYVAPLSNGTTSVNVLLTGLVNQYSNGVNSGMWVGWKSDADNQWHKFQLVPGTGFSEGAEARVVYSYTDTQTQQQLVFVGGGSTYAGGANVGIFTGTYNYATNTIIWTTFPGGGTGTNVTGGGSQFSCPSPRPGYECRTQGMASCSGHLYATWQDQLWERRDGPSPSWTRIYRYPKEATYNLSGFRGLTCVANPNGTGNVLIASLEGPRDIYKFPIYPTIQPVTPTIELHMNN